MSKKSASEMAAHFWAKCLRLEGEGCWEWQAGKTRGGYGQVFFNGKMISSHRVAYALANGPILDGKHVMHSCDNPGCVNPAHLSLGTHLENMADRERKWRAVEPPNALEALRAERAHKHRAKRTEAKAAFVQFQESPLYRSVSLKMHQRLLTHLQALG